MPEPTAPVWSCSRCGAATWQLKRFIGISASKKSASARLTTRTAKTRSCSASRSRRASGRALKRSALLSSLALILGAPWLAESCEEKSRPPAEPTATEPSPNASILPAPLASDVETQTHRPLPSDAGAPFDAGLDAAVPTLRWLKEDEAVEGDAPPHDSTGVR